MRGTDEVWKYNILSGLIYEWPTRPGDALAAEIARIAHHPTPGVRDAEVDQAAEEFLEARA